MAVLVKDDEYSPDIWFFYMQNFTTHVRRITAGRKHYFRPGFVP